MEPTPTLAHLICSVVFAADERLLWYSFEYEMLRRRCFGPAATTEAAAHTSPTCYNLGTWNMASLLMGMQLGAVHVWFDSPLVRKFFTVPMTSCWVDFELFLGAFYNS
jgi:hypothetical protein